MANSLGKVAGVTNTSIGKVAGVSLASIGKVIGVVYEATPTTRTFGYFVGGYNGTSAVVTTDRLSFSSDTTAMVTKASLNTARFGGGAFFSSTTGYMCGGSTGNNGDSAIGTSEGLSFASDTSAMVTKGSMLSLTTAQAAYASSTVGYNSTGYSNGSTPQYSKTEKLTFATDTSTMVTAGSDGGNRYRAGGGMSTTTGYNAGGVYSSSQSTTCRGLSFSSDTSSMVTKGGLATAKQSVNHAMNSSTIAYFTGGYSNANTTANEALTFASDTSNMATKAALLRAGGGQGAVSSSTLGYTAGNTNSGFTTENVSLNFSSDTSTMVTKGVLSVARSSIRAYTNG